MNLNVASVLKFPLKAALFTVAHITVCDVAGVSCGDEPAENYHQICSRLWLLDLSLTGLNESSSR